MILGGCGSGAVVSVCGGALREVGVAGGEDGAADTGVWVCPTLVCEAVEDDVDRESFSSSSWESVMVCSFIELCLFGRQTLLCVL